MKILSRLLFVIFFTTKLLTAQQTMNVFIVVIDGARYSETFGDPAHKNIPNIWNKMRPKGTIYTSFYIEGLTATNPGHATILTGDWQRIKNDGTERPTLPTIFEYYRAQKNAPSTDCFVILGKDKLNVLAYSNHAEYAYPYRALVKYSDSEYDDNVTFTNFMGTIKKSHPRIGIVNFASTDHEGHSGDWLRYLNALHNADSLIFELWRALQSDTFYREKTTLIITGDHGRHLDGVSDGFKSHGDTCEGCRHIATMIIGPDTPEGYVDSARRYQIDIAPTVGRFLNFKTKYSTGRIISSAFQAELKSVGEIIHQKIEIRDGYSNWFNLYSYQPLMQQSTGFLTGGVIFEGFSEEIREGSTGQPVVFNKIIINH